MRPKVFTLPATARDNKFSPLTTVKKKGQPKLPLVGVPVDHAALSHIAVSKALLIIGMFMPKLALAALLAAGLPAATFWVVSVARSHDPCSWERATEKNRST